MIYVKEIETPIKMTGISSFLVQPDKFIPELQIVLDQLQTYYYHKSLRAWEIAIPDLKTFLDNACLIDEITLTLLPDPVDKEYSPVTQQEIDSLKFKPYQHQVDAVNYLLSGHDKYLLCFSMGVGKTLTAIMTAEILHKRGLIEHCVIVCGVDSLRQQWKKEIQDYSDESVFVLGEKITKKGKVAYAPLKERNLQLKNKIEEFFIITNAANLRDDKFIEAFRKSKNKLDMIVVDEIHAFASKQSAQGSNLLKLGAKYKIGMTGTPIINSPMSIYLPLYWTENEHATLGTFRPIYCQYGGFNNKNIVGYKNMDLLIEEINSCVLRKTLDQVRDDMPEKTVKVEYVELNSKHEKFYENIKDGVKNDFELLGNIDENQLLALTIRLRQASIDPSILTNEPISSAKLERCVEIVQQLLAQNEKVVIMSTFKKPTTTLAKLLNEYSPLVVTGDTDADESEKSIRRFMTDPEAKIIIGTTAKLGTGKNLNAASYMIMLDEAWTGALNQQVQERIYRVNNTRPAVIIILIAKDTIDEQVHFIAQEKQELQDYLIDGESNSVSNKLAQQMDHYLRSL